MKYLFILILIHSFIQGNCQRQKALITVDSSAVNIKILKNIDGNTYVLFHGYKNELLNPGIKEKSFFSITLNKDYECVLPETDFKITPSQATGNAIREGWNFLLKYEFYVEFPGSKQVYKAKYAIRYYSECG